jgi:type I restriction enzyme S subunit
MRVPVNEDERSERLGSIPYYGANGIQGYIDNYIFDEPLILLAEDGGYFEEYATRPIAYRVFGKSWVNNHAHVLRARSGYDQDFVFYSLEHKDITPFIKGGTRAKLNQAELRQVTILAPESLPEQRKIACILSTVDDLIERTEALIAKYRAIKQGLMHDLLTRGVDASGRLRPPREEAQGLYRESAVGWMPREWNTRSLGEVVPNSRPIVYGILMPGYGFPGGVPVIKVKDIKNGVVDTSDILLTDPTIDEQYKRSRVQAGDLLFTIRGTVGRTAFVPPQLDGANVTQDTARISVSDGDSRFVRAYLSMPVPSAFIKVHTLGVAVQGINLRDVRRIPIAFPSPDEQKVIADRIEAAETRLYSEQSYSEQMRSIKDGLMQDLLTGRVRVDAADAFGSG